MTLHYRKRSYILGLLKMEAYSDKEIEDATKKNFPIKYDEFQIVHVTSDNKYLEDLVVLMDDYRVFYKQESDRERY